MWKRFLKKTMDCVMVGMTTVVVGMVLIMSTVAGKVAYDEYKSESM